MKNTPRPDLMSSCLSCHAAARTPRAPLVCLPGARDELAAKRDTSGPKTGRLLAYQGPCPVLWACAVIFLLAQSCS
jgi:hypothetical protein